MPRETTIITTIRSDTSESVTIDSVSWTTDFGTITLSASVPAAVNVGDLINDSVGNDYLIVSIAGSVLTCNEFSTTTDPATGAATITEAYDTITLWEADLDAGTNTEAYKSSDNAVGHCFNNTAFDESVTINNGATIGLASTTLTVPASERHDGTEGTGARFVKTASSTCILYTRNVTTEWLEFDMNGNSARVLNHNGGAGQVTVFNHLLIHNASGASANPVNAINNGGNRQADVLNCFIYDMVQTATSTQPQNGIEVDVTSTLNVMNVTIHDILNNGGSGICDGIKVLDDTDTTLQNMIVTDTAGSSSGTKQDFNIPTPVNATMDHNLSSDTTESGAGGLPNGVSADIFVSNSSPYDLHLKSGAAVDPIDAGVDKGTTPAGVNFDIDNRDRDAEGDTWDMGADEFVSVVPSIAATAGAFDFLPNQLPPSVTDY